MYKLEKKVNIEICLEPEELAKAFASMSSFQQAQFLVHLAKITSGWQNPRVFQWQSLRNDLIELGKKGHDALALMREFGEYGDFE